MKERVRLKNHKNNISLEKNHYNELKMRNKEKERTSWRGNCHQSPVSGRLSVYTSRVWNSIGLSWTKKAIMVKAVVGEESQLKKTESRLANSEIPAEVYILSY